FVKLFLIIYLAAIYSKKQEYIGNFLYGAFPPLVMTMFMVGLIILQPDIGTATIILMIVSTIILSSGIKMKHIIFLCTCCFVVLLFLIPKLITDSVLPVLPAPFIHLKILMEMVTTLFNLI